MAERVYKLPFQRHFKGKMLFFNDLYSVFIPLFLNLKSIQAHRDSGQSGEYVKSFFNYFSYLHFVWITMSKLSTYNKRPKVKK